jgi:hypothetical protein
MGNDSQNYYLIFSAKYEKTPVCVGGLGCSCFRMLRCEFVCLYAGVAVAGVWRILMIEKISPSMTVNRE